jgi:hypothetical protein
MTRRETLDECVYCRFSVTISFGLDDVEAFGLFGNFADKSGRLYMLKLYIDFTLQIVGGKTKLHFTNRTIS